ncbi:MAG: GNAT family N-acetyltransferase [Pontibacterium sp.]
MEQIEIKIFDTFPAAESVWKQFEASSIYYAFQDYHWLERWYRHIGKDEGATPCITAIWIKKDNQRQPLMLLPFAVYKTGPLRLLKFMGGEVTDYFAPLVTEKQHLQDPKWFSTLWPEIKKALPAYDAARLIKLPETLETLGNPLLQLDTIPYAESHSATLQPNWDDYYTCQIKKKIRADSRRQRKRLAELGELRFMIAEDDEHYRQITEAMIEHKQRRYAETEVTDLLARDNYRNFYLDHQNAFGSEALIHACALYVGDEIVATHWGAVLDKRYYFLMPTYAGGDWKRYSVGRILLEELMQWCFDQELTVFDFSLGGEQYKKEWCDQAMPLYEVLDAKTLPGQVYVTGQKAKKKLLSNPRILKQVWKIKTYIENR